MQSHLALARRVNHIISFLSPHHTEAEEIEDEILHTLANLHKIFPDWTICTCRFKHSNFFFISDNFNDLLGIDLDLESDNAGIDQFFRRMHPADLEEFNKNVHKISKLLQKEDPEEHHKIRLVFNYRMQRTDGRYMHIRDEKAVLELKNKRHLFYMLLRDVSNEAPYSGFKITAYKEGSNTKLLEYHAGNQACAQLTPRENELIPLMRQGLSIKEAAGCLGISPNTVRNMRQKLFEKFQVNNVIELLNCIEVMEVSFNRNDLATAV